MEKQELVKIFNETEEIYDSLRKSFRNVIKAFMKYAYEKDNSCVTYMFDTKVYVDNVDYTHISYDADTNKAELLSNGDAYLTEGYDIDKVVEIDVLEQVKFIMESNIGTFRDEDDNELDIKVF